YRRVDDELQRRAGELCQLLRQPFRNRGPEGRQGDRPNRPFDGPPENQLPDGPPRGRDFNFDPQGPREFHLPERQAALFDEADTNGFYFIIWRRDGSELARSTNASADAVDFLPRPPMPRPQNNGDGPP